MGHLEREEDPRKKTKTNLRRGEIEFRKDGAVILYTFTDAIVQLGKRERRRRRSIFDFSAVITIVLAIGKGALGRSDKVIICALS